MINCFNIKQNHRNCILKTPNIFTAIIKSNDISDIVLI